MNPTNPYFFGAMNLMSTSTLVKKLSIAAGVAVIALGTTVKVQAATFTESGDAGQTFSSAQNVGGGIDVIQGNVSSNSDADLFSFSWGGGLFNATTLGGASFDTMLQLFSSSGTILTQNDDSAGTLQSTLNVALAAGNYFLGISSWPNYPTSSPTGPNYGTGYSSGRYSISLNHETTSVPEPASTLGLLALGTLGAGSMLKRKKGHVA
jgi:hypothetical protein